MTTQTERVSDERLRPDLASLLERVKAATGPDRELDLALATALVPDVVVLRRNDDGTANEPYTHWEYTGKIDDALALVERLLPSWRWGISSAGVRHGLYDDGKPHYVDGFKAYLTKNSPLRPMPVVADGLTPALAILAALLSALTKEPTSV